jgi:hypothetical protein
MHSVLVVLPPHQRRHDVGFCIFPLHQHILQELVLCFSTSYPEIEFFFKDTFALFRIALEFLWIGWLSELSNPEGFSIVLLAFMADDALDLVLAAAMVRILRAFSFSLSFC